MLHSPSSRAFDPDASIVLVGARGTGKSTLGVISSTAFQRRLIDTDYFFKETTGLSTTAYRKEYGAFNYQQRSLEVLKTVLYNNRSRCVIVCGLVSLSKDGQALLSGYGRTHPVIHIVRDVNSLQDHLKFGEKDRVTSLLEAAEKMFRACSNLEFFNISDGQSFHSSSPGSRSHPASDERSSTPYLALKKTERHFLKFCALATSISNIPALEDAYPLSRVRVDTRSFTYAVSVSVFQLASSQMDIERLEEGADAFELVIDQDTQGNSHQPHFQFFHSSSRTGRYAEYNNISETVARVRRSTVVPLIYHVARMEGSFLNKQKATYIDQTHHGLRLAPEFVTIDLSLTDEEILELMSVKGSTRVIANCFSSNGQLLDWNHEFWVSAYERARSLGFDVVRLCWPATCVADNLSAEHFRAKISALGAPVLPLIAYNTGSLGKTSCCFNPVMTPVSHGDIPRANARARAPTSTASEATRALYASFVFEPMRFYIVGASAGYSLSPAMHNAAYESCGMPHRYSVHETPTLNELRSLVADPHFGGCSVSLPFKLEVIALTHSISPHAKAIGAVNTLIPLRHLQEDGSIPNDVDFFKERNRSGPVLALYGENSDWIGVRSCIRRGLSPANAINPRTSALIIGAGGMARAATYAALKLGVRNIFFFNRTNANAEKLVAHFSRLVAMESSGMSSDPVLPSPVDASTHLQVIKSRDEQWPENFRQPTIVISCIPTHRLGEMPSPDFTLPPQWLDSPTGGVVVEVSPI